MNPDEILPTRGSDPDATSARMAPWDVPRTETKQRALVWIAALFVAAGVVLTWTWSGQLRDGNLAIAGDAFYSFAAARSIAWDGDIDLTNQLMVLGDRWGLGQAPATDGTRFPVRELGPALIMVPGLWVHHLLHAPMQDAPRYAAILGSACLGLCLLAVGWALRRACPESPPRARFIAALFPLGFVVPFYSLGHVGYPHALDATVCALIFGAVATRRRPALIGLAIAAGVLVRMQNFLWLLWPLLLCARAPAGARRRELARCLTTTCVSLLGLAPQAIMAVAHPGSDIGPIRWGASFFDLHDLGGDLWTVLAGRHGLWSATPLAVVASLGLVVAVRTAAPPRSDPGLPASPQVALPAVVVALAMVTLMATVRDPSGGHAFGARRLAGLTPILAFGMLRFMERAATSPPSTRRFVEATVFGLIAINLARTAAAISGALPLAP